MLALNLRTNKVGVANIVGMMKLNQSVLKGSLIFGSRGSKLASLGKGFQNIGLLGTRSYKTSTIDWKPIKAMQGNLATIEYQLKIPYLRGFFLGLMILMPVLSFFLGCWQVKRLKWKNELISKCENNLACEPIDGLPENIDPLAIADFEYRRFKIKGHFDYSQEMFLGPRIKNGNIGYLVITPFIREKGKPLLIERGWISKDKILPQTRNSGYLSHLAFPQGEIEIEALFRSMPEKSYLQFDHEPGSRLFNVHDIPAMAAQSGALPIYCQMIFDLSDKPQWRKHQKKSSWKFWKKADQDDDDVEFIRAHGDDNTLQYQEFEFINQGVPIAQLPKLKFSNNHLQYLITWFGLSFFSAGLLIWSFLRKNKYSSAEKVIAAKRQNMQQNF